MTSDANNRKKRRPERGAPERRARKRAPAGEIGDALRSVYDRAVAEDIPPEMLDLLGKLG